MSSKKVLDHTGILARRDLIRNVQISISQALGPCEHDINRLKITKKLFILI